MTNSLRIVILIFALLTLLFIFYLVHKKKIPIKYSLVWILTSISIALLSIFPQVFIWISNLLGFNLMSNMVIAVFIGLLLLITMVLTVIVSNQNKKITLLIQEISIIKNEVDKK